MVLATAAFAAPAPKTGAAPAAKATPTPPPPAAVVEKPAKPVDEPTFSAEIRAAGIRDTLNRLSDSLDVPMEVDSALGDRRITARIEDLPLRAFQNALASLHQATWRKGERDGKTKAVGPERLAAGIEIATQAERLGDRRRRAFLDRLLDTAAEIRDRPVENVAAAMRAEVGRRNPLIPATGLSEITEDYVRQTLLLAPLRGEPVNALVRSRNIAVPFGTLDLRTRMLFSRLAGSQLGDPDAPVRAAGSVLPPPGFVTRTGGYGPGVLSQPAARVEYRLVYGDRWTGEVLLIRAGAGDTWAQAILPSVLFPLADFGTLYPDAGGRPWGTELREKIDLTIDPNTQTWDQALLSIARKANLNVLTDSYTRPEVFRPVGKAPALTGSSLGSLLDAVSGYYGYVYWKRGPVYVFRHKHWSEEERVAVPERVLASVGSDLAGSNRLSPATLEALADLGEEQLLSLHLYGKAAGAPTAPLAEFSLNDIQVARSGLLAVAALDPVDQQMARTEALPLLLMNPEAQQHFLGVAAARGVAMNPSVQDRWNLRMIEQFRKERLPAGFAQLGSLRFLFDFGPAGIRRADLALRAPAVERPKVKPVPNGPDEAP
jgi:hypothetical protein